MRPPEPSQQETVDAILQRSGRTTRRVPIRESFVQRRGQSRTGPGPVADLVHRGDERSLDLFLLVHALATAPPYDALLSARVWARALGIGGDHATSAVSKTWSRLENARLVERERSGRRVRVRLLREDGTGRVYRAPDGRRDTDRYFSLPFQYWTSDDSWYRRLRLPEKTLLLISLSLQDRFVLPYDRAPEWYGVSTDTARRGLTGLVNHGLLRVQKEWRSTPLIDTGYIEVRHYTLTGAFRSHRGKRRDRP